MTTLAYIYEYFQKGLSSGHFQPKPHFLFFQAFKFHKMQLFLLKISFQSLGLWGYTMQRRGASQNIGNKSLFHH